MGRHQRSRNLAMALLTLVAVLAFGRPQQVAAQEPVPLSITLSGWGWCVDYREIGSVVVNLTGSTAARENATEVEDIYLTGNFTFNLSDRTDNFSLELTGTKVRSLFFLKQVTAGATPLFAEFEGTWLDETDYVACEGRLWTPDPGHVAKLYICVLRTPGVEIVERDGGGWAGNLEFAVQKLTGAFDAVADQLSSTDSVIRKGLGDLLTKAAVLASKVRAAGLPYFT